jgi:hypothetical protein
VVSTCFNHKKEGFLKRGFPQFKKPTILGSPISGNRTEIRLQDGRLPGWYDASGRSPGGWKQNGPLGFFGPMFDQEKLDKISIER